MVYGAFTSNVDMRTGSPAFGTPESVKGQLASGQMARRYGLPWRSSNATASNVVDAQAAYEAEMAVWGAVMGGVNLLYQGAGWLEGGLTASFEKLILDAEILQMMSEVLQPLVVDEATPRLRRHRRRRAGRALLRRPPHTLERYETAFYRPLDLRLAQLRDLAGRRRADRDRAGERRSGSSCSPRTSRRRSTRPSPRRSTPSSPAASARSRPADHTTAIHADQCYKRGHAAWRSRPWSRRQRNSSTGSTGGSPAGWPIRGSRCCAWRS